ncbi:MAG: hypothetical protein KDE51_15255 [Anaerolineales bacterium]|nr:hypothetical protein [Anaerolineales bacterium]
MTANQQLPYHPLLGQAKGVYKRAPVGCLLVLCGVMILFVLAWFFTTVDSITRFERIYRHSPNWDDYLAWGIMFAIQLLIAGGVAYALYRTIKNRHLRVVVYPSGLTWWQGYEETIIRWKDIHTLRHNETNTSYRGARIIVKNYQIELNDGRKFRFDRQLENVGSLGAHIKLHLGYRFRPPAETQIKAGQTVYFGDLALNHEGVLYRGKVVAWEQIESMNITKDHLHIRDANRKTLIKVKAWKIPNLFLVQALGKSILNGRLKLKEDGQKDKVVKISTRPPAKSALKQKSKPSVSVHPQPKSAAPQPKGTRRIPAAPMPLSPTTDFYWAEQKIILRYVGFEPPADFEPASAYAAVKTAYEQAYRQYTQSAQALHQLRQNTAAAAQIEQARDKVQKNLSAYRELQKTYNRLRPLVKIAICPYCHTEVWQKMGLFSLADEMWYYHESDGLDVPRKFICDHLFCIDGALSLNGHQPAEQYASPTAYGRYLRMAAGVPFVIPRLLKLGVTAVIHAIPVAGRYTAFPITYFAPTPIAEHEHFIIPWRAERFSGMHPHRNARYIAFTGTRSDKQEYDLSDAIVAQQVYWLDPQTHTDLLTAAVDAFPYHHINGRYHPYIIQEGDVKDLPDPRAGAPQIEFGDLDESFDR